MNKIVRRTATFVVLPIVLATSGCQATASSQVQDDVVLLTPALPETLNPLAGFDMNGTGKINESLFTLTGGSDTLPQIVPLLATGEPQISKDGLRWIVDLRRDITFSDGSAFDAADVAASYRAIMDPTSASPIAGALENLKSVAQLDAHRVEFELKEPQSSFKTLLLIGIAPSELIVPGQPVSESALNQHPVGTGPYLVQKFEPTQLVLSTNEHYAGGAPEVGRVVYEQSADDNARAQSLAGGGYTGTVLPPKLADSFSGKPGFEVLRATSADWRGISLPADNQFTKDPQVRLALNVGIDRQAMIDAVLAGAGRPAYTFLPPQYQDAYQPSAVFDYDVDRAKKLLDDAGWKAGADGQRSRDGVPAAFSIMYNPGDTIRRDLSVALSAQLEQLGVKTTVQAATFDQAEPRVDTDAIMLGGGDTPYDVDTQLYKMLHSSYPAAGSYWDNPSHYANAAMDRALHAGRVSTDEEARNRAYRKVQDLYVNDPSMLLIAFIDHTYVQSSSVHERWDTGGMLLEPHDHGTAWGPWVKIGDWSRAS
ncbi:ABC transporter substrate-binding protein [Glutamicibacter sp.]|uniref:ABC transporter substrate-binding protein n=1 Tax=Glutamicibacter sp. TaxID=1931995 RepID=UPI0028BE079A|nr:ABC transporter substrate-binding protein [Glutamicibacter sp.]